jgi:hypothetical protein
MHKKDAATTDSVTTAQYLEFNNTSLWTDWGTAEPLVSTESGVGSGSKSGKLGVATGTKG